MDPKRNPGWVRPPHWPYEEDWGSPVWKERMAENNRRLNEEREKFGFIECPKCAVVHTIKTLCCRGCNYRATK